MDLSKLSLVELKAMAFDEIANLQNANNKLMALNNEIARRETKQVSNETKEETK